MKLEIDFKKGFEFGELERKIHTAVADKLAEVAHEAMASIQRKTPVDTGRARAGWRIVKENDLEWAIYNGVEYVVFLEFGHSRQAPVGMVRVTADEVLTKTENMVIKV